MAVYEIKREKTNLNRMGASITGPLGPGDAPGAETVTNGLTFDKKNKTIAEIDLITGRRYLLELWIWGEPGGSVTLSKRLKAGGGTFDPLHEAKIPADPTGNLTAWGFLDFSQKNFTA